MKKKNILVIMLFAIALLFSNKVAAKDYNVKETFIIPNNVFTITDYDFRKSKENNFLSTVNIIDTNDNLFGNMSVVKCGSNYIPSPIPSITRIVVRFIQIAVPLIVIIMGMIDIMKAVTASDEKKLKDSQTKFIKRLIPAALVFLVITIFQLIIGIVADDKSSVLSCINCMVNSSGGCVKVDKPDIPSNNTGSTNTGSTGNSQSNKNLSKSYIKNIKSDGIIITINAKNVDGITGYYFSYDSKRPDKNGGYIATTSETLEVVRLPGKTYVWLEDSKGKISQYKTVTISTNTIVNTKGTILKGTTLRTALSKKGSSVEELNKLIARSVRAAGLYTPEGAATAAVSLVGVLYQEYNLRLPYRGGGKMLFVGASGLWGQKVNDPKYPYFGFDCDGFTHWSYINAGVQIKVSRPHNYWYWDRIPFSKQEGEIGDIIFQYKPNNHVKIIVGKTDKGFITAHANGTGNGVWINVHPYTDVKNFTIIKGSKIAEYYEKNTKYPSGF